MMREVSKAEIWKRLSEEINGRYTQETVEQVGKVEKAHREWTICLDTDETNLDQTVGRTRLRAPFVSADGLRFTVVQQDFLSKVERLFGIKDVKVGYPDFDSAYVVKGTDEAKLKALFENDRIRELIKTQQTLLLTVKDDEGWLGPEYPKNTDVLYFEDIGTIKDLKRLKNLFDLFSELLDQMCKIGSAHKEAPVLPREDQ